MGWDEDLSCLDFEEVLSFRGRKFWAPFFVNFHCRMQTFSDLFLLRGGCGAGDIDQNLVSMVICRELDK